MKVRDLIEELQKVDQDLDVAFQIDPEGNGYRYVDGSILANLNVHDQECVDIDEMNEDGYLPDEMNINVLLLYPWGRRLKWEYGIGIEKKRTQGLL